MKESKAVYATKNKIREENNQEYLIQPDRISEDLYTPEISSYEKGAHSVGCQFDNKRHNVICTCRNLATLRKHREVKQIYAYHGSRSFTDIGVGSVKALQRKKVQRIYLPETDDRGVGSSILSSFIGQRTRQYRSGSYYDHKRTSSKCVGGVIDSNPACVMSEKLSTIIQTKSATTSPQISFENKNIGNNTTEKKFTSITTQVEDENDKEEIDFKVTSDKMTEADPEPVEKVSVQTQKYKDSKEIVPIAKKTEKKDFSSDSLVQHVHNLENPSQYKRSRTSIDPMENKLEREYRKMFSTKSKEAKPSNEKPMQDFKSASLLRRRFEALRRGLGKKDETKKNSVSETRTSSPRVSEISHKDASVTSDPPSLESRSYSNTKTYNPFQLREEQSKYYDTRSSYKKPRDSFHTRTEEVESESQGVRGMFKLWGKKFNLEEDYYKRRPTPKPSVLVKVKPEVKTVPKNGMEGKKEGRKFFFFKKKKDKTKQTFKPKKGFTTGRCEIKDGLMIKIGAVNTPKEEKKQTEIKNELKEILTKTWLETFLTPEIDSRNSVNVRWNNNTYYATSSSTVFELIDTVFKETGVVFKSQSEITTGESSYYKSYRKQRVNFVQNIEAWMIAKTIIDRPKELPIKIQSQSNYNIRDNIEVTISNQKWFIDKSKAFSHKIELVLHSKDIVKVNNKVSSEYLRIDIPKGFFDLSSHESCKRINNHTSDEEVYKIVEYETGSDLKRDNKSLDTGDHISNIKVTVSIKDSKDMESKILETVINRSKVKDNKGLESKIFETVIKQPPVHRDVVIQGSTVCIPKRCDVIGVGIITQRDLRDIRKPILKIQTDISDEDSDDTPETSQKKCEFAESFLQDYYRNWMPLGIDLFSWCVSDSHIGICSENSRISFNNQGDGSRSCPNIYDDFQTSTVLNSSCDTSCCSQCNNKNENQKTNDTFSAKLFKKFVRKQPSKSEPIVGDNSGKRILPKDSLEVFKRRNLYAASNKSNWANSDERPYSVPSIESKGAQNTLIEYPNLKKVSCKPPSPKRKKGTCKKHVSMPDCETMNELLAKQLQDYLPSGILAFKGSGGCEMCQRKGHKCPKHAIAKETPTSELLLPSCKESCERDKKPPCWNTNMFLPPKSPTPSSPPSPSDDPCQSCLKQFLPKNLFSCSPPPEKVKKSSRSPSPRKKCSLKSRPKQYSPENQSPATSNQSSPPLSLERSPLSSPVPKCDPCPVLANKKPSTPSPTLSDNSSHTCYKKISPTPPQVKKISKHKVPKRLSPCSEPCKPCKKRKPGSPSSNSPSPSPSPPGSLKNERVTRCNSPPCNKIKKPKTCKTPPCKKASFSPSSGDRRVSEEYLWPTKNQVSNQPSPEKVHSPPVNAYSDSKKKEKCKKDCTLAPKMSSQSVSKKDKDCALNCANIKRSVELQPGRHPETQPQSIQPSKDCPNSDCSKIKISGLFLKMKPSKKKTFAKECLAWEAEKMDNGVIRLNSHEKLTIRTKSSTPSTEEIREGMNIKVQDEDGKTLYERKDYRKHVKETCHPCHPSVLGDVYKDSKVNRMTTPITVKNIMSETQTNKDVNEEKNESLANLIEIQFKLRVTQGDKTTEINITNDETEKENEANEISESPEIYHVKNEFEKLTGDIDPKNDINIKIVIRNYKPKSDTKKNAKNYNDAFSRKISNKFNTVSTGYSDEFANNVFSVHRATIDLTSSMDKSKTQSRPSEEVLREQLTAHEPINVVISLHSTKQYTTDQTESKTEGNVDEKSILSKKDSDSKNIQDYEKSDEKFQYDTCRTRDSTDVDDKNIAEMRTSEEGKCHSQSYESMNKAKTKREKKELLKKIFEKTHATKTKKKMKQLREMLKIILTSESSENDEMMVTRNELAKDVTYASLKPNYFRDTDSINNYYKIDSTISSTIASDMRSTNIIYPTEENNSKCSKTSDVTSSENELSTAQVCVCNKLAEKLNVCNTGHGGCCCRQVTTTNEETNCDLRNEDDFFLLNYRSEYVDIETQNSKHLTSKVNSTNISIHSHIESNVIQKSLNILAHMEESRLKLGQEGEVKSKIVMNKTFSSYKKHMKDCEMKKLNRNTILSISDDDEIVILGAKPTKVLRDIKFSVKNKEKSRERQKGKGKLKVFKPSDILQSYEIKKAVLEIYAEKTISNNREHIVAKLPKFVYEKESEIRRNYEEIATNSYKSVCKTNTVMSL